MHLRSCIVTILIVWPLLEAAGYWFYRHMQKTQPNPLTAEDPRAPHVKKFRFVVFVVLMPLGVTLSLAILGALDPLFHLIQHSRR